MLYLFFVSLFVSTAGMEITNGLLILSAAGLAAKDFWANRKHGEHKPKATTATEATPISAIEPSAAIIWAQRLALGFLAWVALVALIRLLPDLTAIALNIGAGARWVLSFLALLFWMRRSEDRILRMPLLLIVLVFLIPAVHGLLQYFTGHKWPWTEGPPTLHKFGPYYRSVGFLGMPLTFAYSYGMAILMLVGVWLAKLTDNPLAAGSASPASAGGATSLPFSSSTAWRWIMPLLVVIGFVVIYSTGTRGAWLGLAVAFPVGLALKGKRWLIVGTAGFVMAAGIAAAVVPSFGERAGRMLSFRESSNAGRIHIWRANWQMYLDHPVVGIGLNRNAEVAEPYFRSLQIPEKVPKVHAHNNPLQMLVGLGPVGFFLYLALSLLMMRQAWRLARMGGTSLLRGLGSGALMAQVFFHVGGMTECNFLDLEVNYMLLTIWALILVVSTRPTIGVPPLVSTGPTASG